MLYIEISKAAIRTAGSVYKAVETGDYLLFNGDQIRKMHKFGHGTEADHLEYIRNNYQYIISIDLTRGIIYNSTAKIDIDKIKKLID